MLFKDLLKLIKKENSIIQIIKNNQYWCLIDDIRIGNPKHTDEQLKQLMEFIQKNKLNLILVGDTVCVCEPKYKTNKTNSVNGYEQQIKNYILILEKHKHNNKGE